MRRPPLVIVVVSALHGLLIVALLQAHVTAPLLEGARVPGTGGGESQRLEVVLLEPTPPHVVPPATTVAEIVMPPMLDFATSPSVGMEPAELSNDSRLQGLYLGQVRARIGRAWEALGAPTAADLPDCTIHVTQDRGGQVLDVAVTNCAVDALARAQITRAVRAAAPLPAPPAGLPFRPQVEFGLVRRP